MPLSVKQDGIYKTTNNNSAGFAVCNFSLKLSVHVDGYKDAKTGKPGYLALVKRFPDGMEKWVF